MSGRTREFQRVFEARRVDGTVVEIELYQDFIEVESRAGSERLEGHKSLRLRGGGAVNREAQGRYRIVATEEVVTSDDPDAP